MRNLCAGRCLYPNLCWLGARGSLCGITPELHVCLSRGLSSVQKCLAEALKPPSFPQDLFFLGHSHHWRVLVDQPSIETSVRRKARRCLGFCHHLVQGGFVQIIAKKRELWGNVHSLTPRCMEIPPENSSPAGTQLKTTNRAFCVVLRAQSFVHGVSSASPWVSLVQGHFGTF